jgi:hypothetical protein
VYGEFQWRRERGTASDGVSSFSQLLKSAWSSFQKLFKSQQFLQLYLKSYNSGSKATGLSALSRVVAPCHTCMYEEDMGVASTNFSAS